MNIDLGGKRAIVAGGSQRAISRRKTASNSRSLPEKR